jgi:lipoate synthase
MVITRPTDGATMTTIALKDIHKGQEVTSDYVENGGSVRDAVGNEVSGKQPVIRQYILTKNYHFICECAKCRNCWGCGKNIEFEFKCAKCGGRWCSRKCNDVDDTHFQLCPALSDVKMKLASVICNTPPLSPCLKQ